MDLSVPRRITVASHVIIISLFLEHSTVDNFLERNAESSCLLVGFRKKSAHLSGSLFFPATFLRTPFPCFSVVDSLRLVGMYLSHITSTLLQFSSCLMMCGMNS